MITYSPQRQEPMPKIPHAWLQFLYIVGIGKAAIAGAGVAIAILGAMDVVLAITAQDYLRPLKSSWLEEFTLFGGAVGAAWKVISLLR
jgi:hypothetical protein